MENLNRVESMKIIREELNKISPSMCLAKWLQSTVMLQNGFTHSCHHPRAHKINPNDLKNNPQGLHNTPIKFYAREEMLRGIQTEECNYCWNIENLEVDHLSDRTYKSASSWAWPYKDKIKLLKIGEKINPTYLEVSFENTCNFKCTYCTPDVSSRWMEEIKKHGPVPITNYELHSLDFLEEQGRMPIHRDEYNPYLAAFWEWWPELYQSLKVFRITGGEPLLSEHTWKVLDYIRENPRPDLTLAINTNMGIPKKLVEKLIEYVNDLSTKIKEVQVFTSAEATGAQCEYIRSGMVWNEFDENVNLFLTKTNPALRLNFMVTANLLGATTFSDFLRWIYDLRVKYNDNAAHNRIPIMISYLRWPNHICLTNLPDNLKQQYNTEWRELVKGLVDGEARFYLEELDQVDRLCDFMLSKEPQSVEQSDFYLFYTEQDKRRKTDLLTTFPELFDHWETCYNAAKYFKKA